MRVCVCVCVRVWECVCVCACECVYAGVLTAFNMLGSAVADENNVLIFINNVFQEADVAYTIAGTTVTFTSAPPNMHKIVALRGFDTV